MINLTLVNCHYHLTNSSPKPNLLLVKTVLWGCWNGLLCQSWPSYLEKCDNHLLDSEEISLHFDFGMVQTQDVESVAHFGMFTGLVEHNFVDLHLFLVELVDCVESYEKETAIDLGFDLERRFDLGFGWDCFE